VWCGWACPQTIFIERVFRQIEIWTEGTHLKRRALQKPPLTKEKVIRKTIKWTLFLIAAWIISNSFLAYFVGKEKLLTMIATPPSQNPTSFAIMLFFFGGVLFDFVWFREQFCTLVCPYGRFQSVLMDSNSLLVAYDVERGEPRGKLTKNRDSKLGDCINCNKCVSVCPTGIDIRNGTQMECIACTACIDACDDVMEKINKPKGLIRYTSERMLHGKNFSWFHFRSIAYGAILLFLSIGLAFSLYSKENLKLTQLRHSDKPYEIISTKNKDILQNIVRIRIHNQSDKNYNLEFSLGESYPGLSLINPIPHYPVSSHKSFEISLLLRTEDFKWAKQNIIIKAFDKEKDYFKEIKVQILGPRGEQ
jgi:cytochrome c oxidase accessory protein FixG